MAKRGSDTAKETDGRDAGPDEMEATKAETPGENPGQKTAPDTDVTDEPTPVWLRGRTESFETSRPDGVAVRVTRSLDTGEQTVEPLPQEASWPRTTGPRRSPPPRT